MLDMRAQCRQEAAAMIRIVAGESYGFIVSSIEKGGLCHSCRLQRRKNKTNPAFGCLLGLFIVTLRQG